MYYKHIGNFCKKIYIFVFVSDTVHTCTCILNFRPVQTAIAVTVTSAPWFPRVNVTGRVPEIVRPFVEESGEIASTFMPDFLPYDFCLAFTFSVVVYICLNEHFIVSY